ncbi:MAG TPA: hypothetical protein P5017_06990 [Anaerohalosphaeraceae bacterium]|nr:hypothetical protein [Anaerohalosphaeraceae bacterium]
MTVQEMYYKRVISNELQQLLMDGRELHWLYNLVRERKELDFLIGSNNSQEWVSVYCGTTRLLRISLKRNRVNIAADHKYLKYAKDKGLDIYGIRETTDLYFEKDFVQMLVYLRQDNQLDRYYHNKKEGYFQNLFSRQFGIDGTGHENFAVIDKEAVIGYQDIRAKQNYFSKKQDIFKTIKKHLSEIDANKYGRNISKDALGNEVDFLAVNRSGDVLLIEFKHGSSTKGIYLSPIQIGLYCSIFNDYVRRNRQDFMDNIGEVIKQKKAIGLISPNFPKVSLTGKIIPMLVIAQFNPKSSAFDTFGEVLKICREIFKDNTWLSDLEVYEYDEQRELKRLPY